MKKILLFLIIILFIGCTTDQELPTMFTLSVTSNLTEGGVVNPTSGEYSEGSEVTIRINVNTYYEFDNWSGDWSGSENPLTITMDSNKSLSVNFKLVDNDNDGINNDSDLCPNTPSGETVNGDGCSDSQMDTDGDGVTDDVDQCPDTRTGVNVDENGCFNPLYLDSNGITIKSYEYGEIGDTGIINGIEYTIVNLSMLYQLVHEGGDFSKVCTSKITSMRTPNGAGSRGIFEDYRFNDLVDISHWDMTNVTDVIDMFYNTTFNVNIDISNWDMSNLTNMGSMFFFTTFNVNIDISNWDVSNVLTMSFTFKNSKINGNIDISNWDVSSVESMWITFNGSDFNGDISNWDVSNVTTMYAMFSASPINGVSIGGKFNGNISNWDISSVGDMRSMFMDNTAFNQDLSGWDVTNVTSCGLFFRGNTRWTLPKPNFTNCNPN